MLLIPEFSVSYGPLSYTRSIWLLSTLHTLYTCIYAVWMSIIDLRRQNFRSCIWGRWLPLQCPCAAVWYWIRPGMTSWVSRSGTEFLQLFSPEDTHALWCDRANNWGGLFEMPCAAFISVTSILPLILRQNLYLLSSIFPFLYSLYLLTCRTQTFPSYPCNYTSK